ncbi:mutT, partial [Symbiodinium microadriaticum]
EVIMFALSQMNLHPSCTSLGGMGHEELDFFRGFGDPSFSSSQTGWNPASPGGSMQSLPPPPPLPPAASSSRTRFRNIGSGGHPELCANTCMDFQNGSCLQGADCFLCHCTHPEKHVKLDKKQREALKSLTQRETLEILARRVWDRALLEDMTLQIFPLLQLILKQMYALPQSEPTLSPSGLRNLEKTMGKMSCKRMIIHASTNPQMDPMFAKTMEEE